MKTRTLALRLTGNRAPDSKRDFLALFELPESARNALPEIAIKRREAGRPFEATKALSDGSKKLGIPLGILTPAIAATDTLISAFLPGGNLEADAVSEIVEDLLEAELLNETNRPSIEKWLHQLEQTAQTEARAVRDKVFNVSSGSANLHHIHGVVDVRGIFPFDLSHGSSESTPESTKCLGAVPVALLTLILENSPSEEVHFQVDPSKLEYLINELSLVQKRMESLTKFLNLREP